MIQTVKNEEILKEVYRFLCINFYNEYQKTGEQYYPMYERFLEMNKQFQEHPNLLYYIENSQHEIIASLTSKNLNYEQKSITLGMICVSEDFRCKGVGALLLERFEEDCRKLGLNKISLGSRFEACSFYKKHGYMATLMVQVYDFITVEEILKINLPLNVIDTYKTEFYGFVEFEVDEIKKEYLDYFKEIPTATAQYVFTKYL